jgi:hypothetical protein
MHIDGGITEKDFERKKAEEDIFYFARNVLGHTSSTVQWRNDEGVLQHKTFEGPEYGISQLSPHAEMAELFNHSCPYKHLEAPRDSFKSTFAQAWVMQQALKDRNVRVYWVQETYKEAKKKLRAIRNMFSNIPKIRELWGDLETDVWSNEGFILAGRTDHSLNDPTFEAGGLDVDITGSHRNIIVMDDLVNWKNVRTKDAIDKTLDFFKAMLPLLEPGGSLLVIGTRHDHNDLYGTILGEYKKDFEIKVLEIGVQVTRKEDGTLDIEGEPNFKHLSYEYLAFRLRTMGERDFTAQYLNKILNSDSQVFHREQFKTCTWEGWMKNLQSYIVTDTATTTHDEGCFSVIGVIGIDENNTAYLFDLRIGHWAPTKFVYTLGEVVMQWQSRVKLTHMNLEDVSLNKVFRPQIEDHFKSKNIQLRIEPVPRGSSDASKIQRIQSLAGRFEQGRFFVVTNTVPRTYSHDSRIKTLFDPYGYKTEDGAFLPAGELVDQFIYCTGSGNIDIPDAIADIDFADKKGRRLCPGGGRKSLGLTRGREGRHRDLKQRASRGIGREGSIVGRLASRAGRSAI